MLINRRKLLQTLSLGTGAAILGPMLARIQAHAEGAPLPKRFVFVVEGNGLPQHQIQPVEIERGKGDPASRTLAQDISLKGKTLPPALKPIQPYIDRVTILQGLSGRMCTGGHSNNFGALGCYRSKNQAVLGETVDYAIGRRLDAPHPLVVLGISDSPSDSVVFNCSASKAHCPIPTYCKPDFAYHALFGSVAGGDARRNFDTNKNLLDFLTADIKRAEQALNSSDRSKLQSYFQSIENMRQRHERLVRLEAKLKKHQPPIGDKFKSEVETDRLDAQFDLGAAALIAGLTNTLTIASGVGDPYFSVYFRGLGINTSKHSIGHGGGLGERTSEMLSTQIRLLHFELIARLIEKLKAVPEGDGTMWDNTLIVYLSDAAESHHARCWEWPFVLIGNLGGKIKAGRYIEIPGYRHKDHRTIASLYTTLLNTVGDSRETFGAPDTLLGKDIPQSGPLSVLLA